MKALHLPLLVLGILLMPAAVMPSLAADPPATDPKTLKDVTFREPFTLNLAIDKERYYEEKFDKIPYVHDGAVYLFKGEEFGVNLEVVGGTLKSVKYQPDLSKADVTFKFSQESGLAPVPMMMLKIESRVKYILEMDGLMTAPGKKSIAKTSIIPLRPGLSNFESWPHPIVQLVLLNFRIGTEKK